MTVSLHGKWLLLDVIMSDPELTASACRIAFFLLNHFNTKTGRCDPSHSLLAAESGIAKCTVIRRIDELLRAGYFKREPGGGRGQRTSYQPQWKQSRSRDRLAAETVASAQRNSRVSATKTVALTPPEYRKGIQEEYGKEKTPSPDEEKIVFAGGVIRLTSSEFYALEKTYHGVPDLRTELHSIDNWCITNWRDKPKLKEAWEEKVKSMLNTAHQKYLAMNPREKTIGELMAEGTVF